MRSRSERGVCIARAARTAIAAVAALSAACDGGQRASSPSEFPVRFTVVNRLVAPVTISVDAVPYIGLTGGASSGLTVSSSAQWLSWMSAKPMDARGNPIPDDIGEVRISVGGINRTLEITNVIADQTYVTARIFNLSSAPVSIGLHDGSTLACVSELPAMSGIVAGYTQIGYYRLLPATEIRAYRDPSRCTGAYYAWPSAQLRDFDAKSGLLTLVLDAAP